jgi:signal transduction histidine kinase
MLDQASFRLTRLTEDLLDVTRLQTGLLNLVRDDVDPRALTESIVEQYRDHLPDQFTLRVEIEPCCHIRPIDAARAGAQHLLTNAVKYSPDAGSIVRGVHATDDGVQIMCETRATLLPDRLDQIFEPFARGPGAAARQIPGMGLGLHISRQIVEQHGGRIWATSAGEGLGSTFSVWLPCAPPQHA